MADSDAIFIAKKTQVLSYNFKLESKLSDSFVSSPQRIMRRHEFLRHPSWVKSDDCARAK